MPELPGALSLYFSYFLAYLRTEVERAAGLLRTIAQGKEITDVEAVEDPIVYSGITHTDFVSRRGMWSRTINEQLTTKIAAVKGRVVKDVRRYGLSMTHDLALVVVDCLLVPRQSILHGIRRQGQNACNAFWHDWHVAGQFMHYSADRNQFLNSGVR